jgi:hypothetical protein
MDYLQAQIFQSRHRCAVCGNEIQIYTDPQHRYKVCCTNPDHTGFTKVESYTEAWKAGRSIPLFIANQIQRKEESKMANDYGEETTTKLAPYLGITSLTQEQATYILKTIWPKAPDVEVVKAALICHMYGLNPLMKHLYLVEFKGEEGSTWTPIIGIGATRLIASRNHRYSYVTGPRVMTAKEQQQIRGEVDEKNIWAITILRDEAGNEAPGYGCWSRDKNPYGLDKGNSKANMAFIRSERQAFDRLCPGEMPQGVEVGELQFINTAPAQPPKEPEHQVATSNTTITQAQINKLWLEARRLGYTTEQVHASLKARYGIDTTKALTKEQASEFIQSLVDGENILSNAYPIPEGQAPLEVEKGEE